eukprot:TRINITY_DN20709_c0_g3_i1.p1 TRINITY_DN20709_c0_g3~~TRINITY_DN20709_c0_g3_i1.p1  ORF type:complete len:280 (-),score=37.39 TRINITY_DN20709_c0_g3_i1:109-948(-)
MVVLAIQNPRLEAMAEPLAKEFSQREGTASQRTKRPNILDGQPLSQQLQYYMPPRRPYSRRELLADRAVNFAGAGLAWFAALFLVHRSWAANDSTAKLVCFCLHGAGLIIMLNCSALYHFWAWDWARSEQLLSLDHIGISAMIVGCYGPFMQHCGCYKVLSFVCFLGLAVLPMEAAKLQWRKRVESDGSSGNWSAIDIAHIIRYLVMGWACVVVLPTMRQEIPSGALVAAVTGGLLYSFGIVFFVYQKLEFHLPIWHGAVLLASASFYLANLLELCGQA